MLLREAGPSSSAFSSAAVTRKPGNAWPRPPRGAPAALMSTCKPRAPTPTATRLTFARRKWGNCNCASGKGSRAAWPLALLAPRLRPPLPRPPLPPLSPCPRTAPLLPSRSWSSASSTPPLAGLLPRPPSLLPRLWLLLEPLPTGSLVVGLLGLLLEPLPMIPALPRWLPSGGVCSASRTISPLPLCLGPGRARARPMPVRAPLARTRPCAGAPCLLSTCVSRSRLVLPRPAAERPPSRLCLTSTSASAWLRASPALLAVVTELLPPPGLPGARSRCATRRCRPWCLRRLWCLRLPSSLLSRVRSLPHRCRRRPPCLARRSPYGRSLATSAPRPPLVESARAFPAAPRCRALSSSLCSSPREWLRCGGLPAPVLA